MKPVILTHSGIYFDFTDPEHSDINIIDIAWALSHICRFTGHVQSFYSVAQHSVLVSYLVPPEHAMEALLHDASEAYLNDLSSPLKQLLPDYRALEAKIEKAIFDRFNIKLPLNPCIKQADMTALCTERRDLMPDDNGVFDWFEGTNIKPIDVQIIAEDSDIAYYLFMDRFNELKEMEAIK